jgi:hypothetical protein
MARRWQNQNDSWNEAVIKSGAGLWPRLREEDEGWSIWLDFRTPSLPVGPDMPPASLATQFVQRCDQHRPWLRRGVMTRDEIKDPQGLSARCEGEASDG